MASAPQLTPEGYLLWRVSLGTEAEHVLYLRPHREKGSRKPILFVANLPGSDLDEEALRQALEDYGDVLDVSAGTLHKQDSVFQTNFARVEMDSQDSVDRVMKGSTFNLEAFKKSIEEHFTGGLKGMLDFHQREHLGEAELEKWVKTTLDAYDDRKKQERLERESKEQEVDDEGFQTATKGFDASRPTALAERLKKKKKKQSVEGLPNFYRFKEREEKRRRVQNLRENFKKDQERVRVLMSDKSES